MTWTIAIPHRTRRDSISDLGANARALPSPEDRAVIRQLALVAGECGAPDVGEVIDLVKSLDVDQRRKALETLRRRAGLKSIGEIERESAFKERQMHTVTESRPVEPCAAEGCQAVPLHPTTWMPIDLDVKRFWCPTHAAQAAPGDSDPRPSGMRLAPGGGLEEIPDDVIRPVATGAGWS